MATTTSTVFRFCPSKGSVTFQEFTLNLDDCRSVTIFNIFQHYVQTPSITPPLPELARFAQICPGPSQDLLSTPLSGSSTLAELAAAHAPHGGTVTITLEVRILSGG